MMMEPRIRLSGLLRKSRATALSASRVLPGLEAVALKKSGQILRGDLDKHPLLACFIHLELPFHALAFLNLSYYRASWRISQG